MQNNGQCPEHDSMVKALSGQLSRYEADTIAMHVETCRACAEALSAIDNQDTVFEGLGNSSRCLEAATPDISVELLTRLKELRNEPFPYIPTLQREEALKAFPFLSPPKANWQLGTLANYAIIKLLGRGGMGLVFEAVDLNQLQPVAIKVLGPHLSHLESARSRFRREAQTISKLSHVNIVGLIDAGEVGSVMYLVTRLLEGASFEKLIAAKGMLPLRQIDQFGRQMLHALVHAHNCGIIHRDLKPSNIFIEQHTDRQSEFRVCILDFGLAKILQKTDSLVTEQGALIGTPAYMAPEQMRGLPAEARSDLFSLGAILYEITTGVRPFAGADTLAIMANVATIQPTAPHELRPEIPLSLSQLIMQLLVKEPTLRPQSAQLVLEKWEAIFSEPKESSLAIKKTSLPLKLLGNYPSLLMVVALLLIGVFTYFAGGTILRFSTNRGQLIVQIEDPEVEIRVRKNDLVVHDWSTKRKFTLSVGDGTIEVMGDHGKLFASREFELKRGATTIVSVQFERSDAPRIDSVRELIEMIIAQHGEVKLSSNDADFIKEGDPLPESITGLHWIWWDNPNREGIDALLNLATTLDSLPEILYIGGSALNDADLDRLSKSRIGAGINSLSLRESNLSKQSLAPLSRLPKLKFLSVECGQVNDEWLVEIAKLSNLTGLGVPEASVTNEGLAALRSLKLEVLNLHNCRNVSSAGVTNLQELQLLTDLNLYGTSVEGSDLLQLQKFPRLSMLWIGNTNISETDLAGLSELKRLRILEATDLGITDRGLVHFEKCNQLASVDLSRNAVTVEGLRKLQESLPNCKIQSELSP